jgi:predicted SAM-dependent methyltransferase
LAKWLKLLKKDYKNMTRKLEIGSGNRPLEGYEHLDINPDCPHVEYVSPMDNIPTEDNVFEEVIAIHVLEHASWRDTSQILSEWVRVLAPGGKVKIALPNLRFIMQSYLDAKNGNDTAIVEDFNKMHEIEQEHLLINGKINYCMWANFKIMSSSAKWDQHYACYDAGTLCDLVLNAGCSKAYVEHDGDSLIIVGIK